MLIRLTGTDCLAAAGLEVVEVADNEGVRRAVAEAGQPFDLIVLNGKLPDGKGTDVCAELRRAGIGVPILMQSGYGSTDHYREAMRAGISDYLEKPWLPSELVERVNMLLDMPPIERPLLRASATSRGSNLPSVQAYCLPRIRSALEHLEAVRPAGGTLPIHVPGVGEDERKDVRVVALDEKGSDELLATLKAIERHLAHNAGDMEERARLRAELLIPLHATIGWLAGRATVVTDEIIKKYVPLGLAAYVAHLYGLRIDLFHILVALGLTPLGH